MQGHTLKFDVVLAKGGFEVVGAIVINDLEGGRISVVLYLGVTVVPGIFDQAILAVFDGY